MFPAQAASLTSNADSLTRHLEERIAQASKPAVAPTPTPRRRRRAWFEAQRPAPRARSTKGKGVEQ